MPTSRRALGLDQYEIVLRQCNSNNVTNGARRWSPRSPQCIDILYTHYAVLRVVLRAEVTPNCIDTMLDDAILIPY